MKEIKIEEQKRILVDILKYIDKICRKNNIKYTLIGGSLIGAIRNGGIIPWDDDIDIGLLPKEYEKLITCLKNNNSRYKLLDVETEPSYYYPFAKVVDTKTFGYETGFKKINNYGIYVDIFKFNNLPDSNEKVKEYYDICKKNKNRIMYSATIDSNNFIKKIFHRIMSLQNSTKLAKKYIKYCEKYNGKTCCKVMINWIAYDSAEKQANMISDFNEYITIKFENIDAMIIKNYDHFLKTTFGDYMTPPPIEKQITHHSMKMYWK